MTPEQRDEVRANAAYLRGVRPIDPEEIYAYVDGQPHPAAVRQVLRELGPDLGLVEREDGSFVPVPEEPVPPRRDPVERFPERYAERLEAFLVERYGRDWAVGDAGARLRETIRRLKEDYFGGRSVAYDPDVAAGYAIYHLPDYYAAIQAVLDDLAGCGLLGRRLRVLDVGAGTGGPALGLFDYLPSDALVEYHAVEPSAAAEVLEALLEDAGRNVHATVHRERAESFDPRGDGDGGRDEDGHGWDLLLFANVLSELDDPAGVVRRYAEALAPDGSVVLLAPADRATSTGLRSVERAVTNGLGVFGPTVRLWPGAEPAGRCWSFDVEPDLEVPTFQRRLDEAGGGSGEFSNVDVQFSYAILRGDGRRRIAFTPSEDRYARLADAERNVTARIDCVGIKLSHDLADGGNPIFLVGDGSQRVDHFAVLTRETSLNRDLLEAGYGDLLAFEGVLVLWNDDEGAYNLVVDDEALVDRIGPWS